MTRSAVQSIAVAFAVVSAVGCQSMQSMSSKVAWWKHDKAPDATANAAATAPSLPSTLANPQAVAGTGIQPATSPSSANLAAARSTTSLATTPQSASATSVSIGTSPYPTTGAPAPAYPAAPTTSIVAAGSTGPAASLAQAAPYDPNGYRPSSASSNAALSGADVATGRYAAAAITPNSDRYGLSGSTPAASSQSAATIAMNPTSSAAADPAANSIGDRYALPAASAAGASLAAAAASSNPTAAVPTTSTTAGRYNAVPTSASSSSTPGGFIPATAQLTTPAGQYRPGGTSNYAGPASGDHVEVATRPSDAAPPLPSEGTIPATYPPLPPSSTGGGGVRPY